MSTEPEYPLNEDFRGYIATTPVIPIKSKVDSLNDKDLQANRFSKRSKKTRSKPCINCKKRKIKCQPYSAATNTCHECFKRNWNCTYNNDSTIEPYQTCISCKLKRKLCTLQKGSKKCNECLLYDVECTFDDLENPIIRDFSKDGKIHHSKVDSIHRSSILVSNHPLLGSKDNSNFQKKDSLVFHIHEKNDQQINLSYQQLESVRNVIRYPLTSIKLIDLYFLKVHPHLLILESSEFRTSHQKNEIDPLLLIMVYLHGLSFYENDEARELHLSAVSTLENFMVTLFKDDIVTLSQGPTLQQCHAIVLLMSYNFKHVFKDSVLRKLDFYRLASSTLVSGIEALGLNRGVESIYGAVVLYCYYFDKVYSSIAFLPSKVDSDNWILSNEQDITYFPAELVELADLYSHSLKTIFSVKYLNGNVETLILNSYEIFERINLHYHTLSVEDYSSCFTSVLLELLILKVILTKVLNEGLNISNVGTFVKDQISITTERIHTLWDNITPEYLNGTLLNHFGILNSPIVFKSVIQLLKKLEFDIEIFERQFDEKLSTLSHTVEALGPIKDHINKYF